MAMRRQRSGTASGASRPDLRVRRSGRRPPTAGGRSALSFVVVVSLLLLPAVGGPAQGVAVCPGGATEWSTGVDGDWSDAGKWSLGEPDGSTTACIAVAGTYTVTVTAPDEIAAGVLILNPDATLHLLDSAGLATGPSVTNDGTIEVGTAGVGFPAGAGPAAAPTILQGINLDNNGVLRTNPSPSELRVVQFATQMLNHVTGVVEFLGPTAMQSGHIENDGQVTIAAPTQAHHPGGPDETGQLLNGGQFNVDSFFDITYRIDFQNDPGGTTRVDAEMEVRHPGTDALQGNLDNAGGTLDLGPGGIIETEIVSMDLTGGTELRLDGFGPGEVPVLITEDIVFPDPPPLGTGSFFDVFFEVEIPGCLAFGDSCPPVPLVQTGGSVDPLDAKGVEVSNPDPRYEHELVWDDVEDTIFLITTVNKVIDIEVEKSVAVVSETSGSPRVLDFILTVRNAPVPPVNEIAVGVEVTDVLDPVLTFISTTGSYDPITGIWDVGALNPAEEKTVTIRVRQDAPGPLLNCAEATAYDDALDPDSFAANGDVDEDDMDCVLVDAIDIEVTKQLKDPQPAPADPRRFEFEITATNNAANASVTATGVVVEDLLPSGLSYVSHVATPEPYDPVTGLWTIGDIDPGEIKTLTILVEVTGTTSQRNCAFATSYTGYDFDSGPNRPDPPQANEDDESCLDLSNDVSVSKGLAGVSIVDDETRVSFRITVTNSSSATVSATDVEVKDDLPGGYSFVNASTSKGSYDDGTGIWSGLGDLLPGESETLDINTNLLDGDHENCAFATAYGDLDDDSDPEADLTGLDDEDDESCLEAVIDLEVDKVFKSETTSPGGDRRVTYEVTVTNAQPPATLPAIGVEVEDVLPAGTTYVSATGTHTHDTGVVTWEPDELLPGDSEVFDLVVDVTSAGPHTNCAEGSAYDDVLDPDSTAGNLAGTEVEDDESCVTLAEIDIEVTKTVDDATPLVGDEVTYTITVANDSPPATASATGVQVADYLPPEVTYVSHVAPGGTTYDATSHVWTVGTLAPDAVRVLTIRARVDEAGTFDNCAEASAYNGLWDIDSDPGNLVVVPAEDDEDCVAATASQPPTTDVSLTKTVTVDDPVVAGATAVYTVTVANAPGALTATGVVVTDYLPDDVFVAGGETTQGGFDPDSGVWTVGTLVAGATATLTLEVTLDDDEPGRNCAAVTAGGGPDRDSTAEPFDPATEDPDQDDEACADPDDGDVDASLSDPTPAAGGSVDIRLVARDGAGRTRAGVRLGLRVRGANGPGFRASGSPLRTASASSYGRAGTDTADVGGDGSATFTLDGFNPGIDRLIAFVDDNRNGVLDPGERTRSFDLVWSGDGEAVRLAGDNREQTAVASSKAAFPVDGSASAVVLTRRDEFADGLAGTPFAYSVDAPLLVTATGSLHPASRAELQRVLPVGGTVYLLGGTSAISSAVSGEVGALGYRIERIGGLDRYATAVLIAQRLGEVDTVFVSRSLVFADALAAGPAAIAANGAIVLSAEDAPHPATDAYLAEHPDADVFAIGGPAATAYPSASRLVGAGREATAVLVAERFFPDAPVAGFARRDEFVDALTGGVHIGRLGGPVLLTDSGVLHASPAGYLDAHADTLTQAYVYGGVVAVSEAVRALIASHLD